MRDFRDVKAMAQTLREALKAKSVSLTHSESLELVAKILGFHDWNVLSAAVQAEREPRLITPAAMPPGSAGAPLPTVPLRDLVLFPNMIAPLLMGRDASKRAVERAMAFDQRILAVTQRRATDDNPTPEGLYGVGVTASVIDFTPLDDGTIRLLVKGLARAAIVQTAEGQFLTAEIAAVEETRGLEAEAFDLSRAVLEECRAYRNASLAAAPYARLPHIREPSVLADAVAPFLWVEIDRRQDLLETSDVVARLDKILALMKGDRLAA
jgi:ATP-dependent Lon protease